MSLLNRELDYFLAICETRNLARAAEALDISQPALTRSLQRLEARFGTKLFIRAPRGVELTPIGVALRARAEKARMTLDDAETEVAQLSAGKIGKVRVGAGPLWAHLVSRSLFPRFIVERPAAQVQLHVAFAPELFALVDGGKLDFAVSGLIEAPPANLVFHELLVSSMVVIVRVGHPISTMEKPTLRDLSQFRGAAPGAGMPVRQMVEERFATLGIRRLSYAIETNSWEAMLDAVATTDCYSLAPRHAALWHGWASRLVTVEIPELEIGQRIGVFTRAEGYLSPLAARAVELIEHSFREDSGDETVRQTRARRSPARSTVT
jgi:DNA-binding transcriptional LysR family regulator